MPFSESDGVDHPLSLYAASKKSNELMAHSYCSLFNIPTIGLRFFTVYGPWGRPDMALFLFTKAIISGDPIKVFNNGKMLRDFTYIDDVIKSINLLIKKPATSYPFFDKKKPDPSISWVPYKIFNIGNSKPISLMEYINAIEDSLGTKAIIDYQPLQAGDVEATSADISNLVKYINYRPNTSVKVGIGKFVDWYKNFYKIY
jgi:UDP-glucuronate 4-epimerase